MLSSNAWKDLRAACTVCALSRQLEEEGEPGVSTIAPRSAQPRRGARRSSRRHRAAGERACDFDNRDFEAVNRLHHARVGAASSN